MANYGLEFVKRIAVFMIIAQTILQFRSNKSYEKYLKMLIGIMMLAIVIVPLTNVFRKGSMVQYERMLEGYEKNIERMYETSNFQLNLQEEAYLYTLKEEIKYRFNNISNAYGYQVENVELQGVLGNLEQEVENTYEASGYVQVEIKSRDKKISTVQVDKIKSYDNKFTEVSGTIPDSVKEDCFVLREKFAECLGIGEESIRIVYIS